MTSMHRPDLPHYIPPLAYEGGDLVGLRRHLLGNVYEQGDFAIHDAKVRMWDYPALHHCPVSVQGLAGLDDAGVGFFGGHAIMCSNGTSAVNGGVS